MTIIRKTFRATLSSGLAASVCSALLAFGCGSGSPSDAGPSYRGGGAEGLESNDAEPDDTFQGTVSGGDPDVAGVGAREKERRVVGYLPTYRFESKTALHLDTLTHLVLAFALPNSQGDAELLLPPVGGVRKPASPAAIRRIVGEAQAAHVKVLVALAGGGDISTTERLKPSADSVDGKNRVESYVSSVMDLVDTYGFDGVDVDIEGEAIDSETFEPLMVQLAHRLHDGPVRKLLTAAVANYLSKNYRALGVADFLSIMSYDQCGGWSGPCEHSTKDQAKNDLREWSSRSQTDVNGEERKLGADNVVLGAPFYARCWGKDCPESVIDENGQYIVELSYAQIASYCESGTFAGCSSSSDVLSGKETQRDYYVSLNSPTTIGEKANLAKGYGGIMIWELGQDSSKGELFAPIASTFPKPVSSAGSGAPGLAD